MNLKSKESLFEELFLRYPVLSVCREDIGDAYEKLAACFRAGGRVLLCGNGGSAADCGHIAGELMKGFLRRRPLTSPLREALQAEGERGAALAEKLQGALPCFDLTVSAPLITAFANDVDPAMIFAQQVVGLGRKGDLLVAISTSGNAANVADAAIAARAVGMTVLGLTGESGGRLATLSDTVIRVPEKETYRIQELHLPVYHVLCAMLEAEFFAS